MKAGLDIGRTGIIKVAWANEDEKSVSFFSSVDIPANKLFEELMNRGIDELIVTGRGSIDIPNHFKLTDCDGHLNAWARGINTTLPTMGINDLDSWFAVILGAGITYAAHDCGSGETSQMPFPSALGGDLLQGHVISLGLDNVMQMADLASRGAPPDILDRDIDSESGGTIFGDLPAVHFGDVNAITPIEDFCAGYIDVLANEVIRRSVMYIRFSMRNFFEKYGGEFPPVMVVGTPTNRLPAVRNAVMLRLTQGAFIPVFPTYSEYLAAYGALIMP